MTDDHDHPYKRLFSRPEMVRDLLHGFVDGLSQVETRDLERCNGSYVSDSWKEREDDGEVSLRSLEFHHAAGNP